MEHDRLSLNDPVFQFDAGNDAEFASLVSNNSDVPVNSPACDLDIVRSDWLTGFYKFHANSPGDYCIVPCKRRTWKAERNNRKSSIF